MTALKNTSMFERWEEYPEASNICELVMNSDAIEHNAWYGKCERYFNLIEASKFGMETKELYDYLCSSLIRFKLAEMCWKAGRPIDLSEEQIVDLLCVENDLP